jgi:hypothetical protein
MVNPDRIREWTYATHETYGTDNGRDELPLVRYRMEDGKRPEQRADEQELVPTVVVLGESVSRAFYRKQPTANCQS